MAIKTSDASLVPSNIQIKHRFIAKSGDVHFDASKLTPTAARRWDRATARNASPPIIFRKGG